MTQPTLKKECSLNIKIEPKTDLDRILAGSESIPPNELHILKDSEMGKELAGFPIPLSFTLEAISAWISEPRTTVGFIKEPKLIYTTHQKTPLGLNSLITEREKDRFRNSENYSYYELNFSNLPLKKDPAQDMEIIKFYTDSPYISYNTRFSDIIGHSDDIPPEELHVREDSEHAKILRHAEKLQYLVPPVSLELRSFLSMPYDDWRDDYGPTHFNFGSFPELRLVYVKYQRLPLLINSIKSLSDYHSLYSGSCYSCYIEINSAKKEGVKK